MASPHLCGFLLLLLSGTLQAGLITRPPSDATRRATILSEEGGVRTYELVHMAHRVREPEKAARRFSTKHTCILTRPPIGLYM